MKTSNAEPGSTLNMPSFGADMEDGVLLEWRIKAGDSVAKGDVVAVIDTQKGAIDMEAFAAATITELLIGAGSRVPVGTPLARIKTSAPRSTRPGDSADQRPPSAASDAAGSRLDSPVQHSNGGGIRSKASPLARRLARQRHVDLNSLQGSGPGGAIIAADIDQQPAAAAAPQGPAPTAPSATADAGSAVAMRNAIAAAMSRSKREIPHYYLDTSVDIEPLLQWLQRQNAQRPPEQRLLLAAMLLKAIANTLVHFPALNGVYQQQRFIPATSIHLGTVIKLRNGGLLIAAIHDADQKTPDQLMACLLDLTRRARSGRLRSSERSDATITVSSLGERGVERLFGVIYPPQVALIGIGSPLKRPWLVADRIEPRTLLNISLSGDHRVSDGHLGAVFLRQLEQQLQAPETL